MERFGKFKKWGVTSPWKRRWNTKLGINYKQWFWVSILSNYCLFLFGQYLQSHPWWVTLWVFTTGVMISAVGFPPPFWGKESLAWKMKLFDGIAYGVWKVISRWTVRSDFWLNDVAIQELLTSKDHEYHVFFIHVLMVIMMRQELIERVLWLMVYHGGNAACNRILYIHGRAW